MPTTISTFSPPPTSTKVCTDIYVQKKFCCIFSKHLSNTFTSFVSICPPDPKVIYATLFCRFRRKNVLSYFKIEVWETKKVCFITSFLWSPLYNRIVPLIALSFLLCYHSLDMLEWASFRLVFMSLWYHINVLSSESLESSFLLGWFWHQCVTYLIGLYGNKLGWVGLLRSYVLHIYLFDVERNKHKGSGCGHNIWQKREVEGVLHQKVVILVRDVQLLS